MVLLRPVGTLAIPELIDIVQVGKTSAGGTGREVSRCRS